MVKLGRKTAKEGYLPSDNINLISKERHFQLKDRMAGLKHLTMFHNIHEQRAERMDSNDSGISDQEYLSSESSGSQSSTDCEITSSTTTASNSPSKCDKKLSKTQQFTQTLCKIVIINMCHKTSPELTTLNSKDKKKIDTLMKITEKILSTNQKTFQNMINSLKITSVNHAELSLKRVYNEVFSDKNPNWGRIATVVAFAVEVSRYGQKLVSDESKLFPEKISEFVSNYINGNLSNWIDSHGGWDGMEEFFAEENKSEGSFWKGLLYTVFGIGALATTVVAIR